jgi:SAM-dependent methyltransferase
VSTTRDSLPLTGERTVPGIPAENYWFRRHEAAYRWALPHLRGRTVLEVGCGEGYGAAMIAGVAARVTGVDYDTITVAHAAAHYPQARFVRASLAALPVRCAVVDVVATLQVIEHVWDHAEFLAECRRVLRPGGTLVVTTPNRLTFSPGSGEHDRPRNPFHTVEFTAAQLARLLTRCGFDVHLVAGLHAGSRLAALDGRHGASFVDAQLAGAPADWPRALHADVESVRVDDFEVRAGDGVEACLDLVVLATRR